MFMRGKFREIYIVCLMLWMIQAQGSEDSLEVIYPSQQLQATEGDVLDLTCTVQYSLNNAKPNISWCKIGEKECSLMQDDYSHKIIFMKGKGQEGETIADLVNLQFLSIKQSDEGRYQCQARGTGSTSARGHIITISVQKSTVRSEVDPTNGNGATSVLEMSAHTLGILIVLQQSIVMFSF